MRKLLVARSAMMAFAMSLPVLAAIISFITYSLNDHGLNAATIFAVITLFQLMRMPLMIWPMSLSATADALKRHQCLEEVSSTRRSCMAVGSSTRQNDRGAGRARIRSRGTRRGHH